MHWPLLLIVLSNYFFGVGENLIAAFLPELADSKAMGRVSGWGWAFGYLGGLTALGICLAYILSAKGSPASETVPVTMLITAAFFALAATPTFVFLRERSTPQPQTGKPLARVLRDAARRDALSRPARASCSASCSTRPASPR